MPSSRSMSFPCRLLGAMLLLATGLPALAETELEEVVVTARLREQAIQDTPASISVVSGELIRQRQAEHIEELLNMAPNVNYAAGASRGRYLQVRGIGERSQFVDPVDPSVGLYIDGIDFTGLGNAATLFDIEQLEVLRGPQGTAFGASAMAGMINLRSAAPTSAFFGSVEGGLAEYGGNTLGIVLSGPLGDSVGARVAVHRNASDGYIENDYLDRDDTNEIDEVTVRGRLDWRASAGLDLGLTALHVDADNGYDAFSLDNTRHTLSDQPGRDRQTSDALALNARWSGVEAFRLEAVGTWSSSDLDYGYDEDWSYPDICTGTPCEGWEYASTDRYIRDVSVASLDLRLVSQPGRELGGRAAWVAGVYASSRETELDRRFFDFDAGFPPPPSRFLSDYTNDRVALYGELDTALTERLEWVTGLRLERFDGDYRDSLGIAAGPDDDMWGGELSLRYALTPGAMLYVLASRGYKAGGVNGEALGKASESGLDESVIAFLRTRLEYESETLYNYELGYKATFADGALSLRAALFYMDRDDVQLRGWYNEGPLFVGYTDNAASGENYGLEFEGEWRALQRLRINWGLGLLGTEIDGFSAFDPDDPDAGLIDRSGRDQAHAPSYQFTLGAELGLSPRVFARADVEGKDAFYFSDSHDRKSDAYALLHLGLAYRGARLEASLWVRNVFDEDYAVRGFYFGNDPRKFYVNEAYHQYGEPRVAGLSVRYTL